MFLVVHSHRCGVILSSSQRNTDALSLFGSLYTLYSFCTILNLYENVHLCQGSFVITSSWCYFTDGQLPFTLIATGRFLGPWRGILHAVPEKTSPKQPSPRRVRLSTSVRCTVGKNLYSDEFCNTDSGGEIIDQLAVRTKNFQF